MKKNWSSIVKSLTLGLAVTMVAGAQPSYASGDDTYLGQTPPGLTPEIFAPGLVSTEDVFELNAVFSPDGSRFLFTRRIGENFKIHEMVRTKVGWSKPEITSFSNELSSSYDADPAFTPDGKRVYYISKRPLEGFPENEYNFWYSDLVDGNWTAAKALPRPINSDKPDYYPTITADGSLYFATEGGDTLGQNDNYRAQYKDGAFLKPKNLGPNINTATNEGDVFVAPDESYLIHTAFGRPENLSERSDLFISFRGTDGNWGKDIHMGDIINSKGLDFCPIVSPDGRYFFFSRDGDVYWVSAEIIEQFRPDNIK